MKQIIKMPIGITLWSVNILNFLKRSRPGFYIFLEAVGGIAFSFFSLYVFLRLSEKVYSQTVTRYDALIENYVYSLRFPALDSVMMFITNLGSAYFIVPAVLVFLFLLWKRHRRQALLLVASLLASAAITNIIKYIIQKPRPGISPLIQENFYTFPSGHAMSSFVFYALLVYFVWHLSRNFKLTALAAIVASVLIFLVGFSRVYLGVHNPSDVLAGEIAGFWLFVTVLAIDKTAEFYGLYERADKLI